MHIRTLFSNMFKYRPLFVSLRKEMYTGDNKKAMQTYLNVFSFEKLTLFAKVNIKLSLRESVYTIIKKL